MNRRIKPTENNVTDKKPNYDWIYFLTALAIVAAMICAAVFLPRALGKTVVTRPLSETENVAAGDHFYFGSYPQYTGGPEPIKWRVLAAEGGKALVISDELLDCRAFDGTSGAWETSELRQWLNGGFMDAAFTDGEKKLITLTSNVDTGTEDRVFCLSAGEAERYLGKKGERLAAPTAYAVERGAYTNEEYMFTSTLNTGWWWLRSPGSSDTIALCVNSGGSVSGVRASGGGGCVRPAMWVSLPEENG